MLLKGEIDSLLLSCGSHPPFLFADLIAREFTKGGLVKEGLAIYVLLIIISLLLNPPLLNPPLNSRFM